MNIQIKLGEIVANIVKKNIKNLHLSVHPPQGNVRIAVPLRMRIDTVRIFAISKLGWIRKQQKKLQEQVRESPREYIDRESHYVWGKRYLLKIIENSKLPLVELQPNQLYLQVPTGTSKEKKQAMIEKWYRIELKKIATVFIAKWEPRMEVKVSKVFIQKMKTRWGSCRPDVGHIRLNTMLAKKPLDCLEYIVIHEMVHLLESTHNARFKSLMDKFMPKWRFHRAELNRLPIEHEHWKYKL